MRLKYIMIFDVIMFCIVSAIAIQLSYKGFAGYDLSPMISSNNMALLHVAQRNAVSNPMPPGFTFIVYLFTAIIGGGYISYFVGNIIFCGTLYVILLFLIRRFKDKGEVYVMLHVQTLMIFAINLVSDGHFYISDTSNIYSCFVFVLFEVIVLMYLYKQRQSYWLNVIFLFSLSFVLFFRQNIAVMTFALLFVSWVIFQYGTTRDYFKVLIGVVLVVLFVLLCSIVLHYAIGFEQRGYLKVVSVLMRNRGSLDYGNLNINIQNLSGFEFEKKDQLIKYFAFSALFILLGYLLVLRNNISKSVSLVALLFFPNMYLLSALWYSVILISGIMLTLINYNMFISWRKRTDRGLWPFFLCLMASAYFVFGLICMMTNYDVKSSDFPLLLTSVILIFISYKVNSLVQDSVINTMMVFMVLLIGIFMYEGLERIKIIKAGPPASEIDFNSTINDGFFVDLKTSKYHSDVIKSIDKVLRDNPHVLSSGKVMFGPRMEYLYAKYKVLPPKGIPLWWHYSTAYTDRDIQGIKSVLDGDAIDMIIFEKVCDGPDTALMDDDTKRYIFSEDRYYVDKSYDQIFVLKRNR